VDGTNTVVISVFEDVYVVYSTTIRKGVVSVDSLSHGLLCCLACTMPPKKRGTAKRAAVKELPSSESMVSVKMLECLPQCIFRHYFSTGYRSCCGQERRLCALQDS
jgi:hypothetical protein